MQGLMGGHRESVGRTMPRSTPSTTVNIKLKTNATTSQHKCRKVVVSSRQRADCCFEGRARALISSILSTHERTPYPLLFFSFRLYATFHFPSPLHPPSRSLHCFHERTFWTVCIRQSRLAVQLDRRISQPRSHLAGQELARTVAANDKEAFTGGSVVKRSAYIWVEQPSNAMTSSDERTSAEAGSRSKLLHRKATGGLLRPPFYGGTKEIHQVCPQANTRQEGFLVTELSDWPGCSTFCSVHGNAAFQVNEVDRGA